MKSKPRNHEVFWSVTLATMLPALIVTDGFQLEENRIYDTFIDKGYTYSGISGNHENTQAAVKNNAQRAYEKRVRQVFRLKVYENKNTLVINAYVSPVTSYTAEVVD